MKRSFYLLPLLSSVAVAQVAQVQVRVVTFQKAGALVAFRAGTPDGDEALYKALAAEVSAGTARRVQDQTLVVRAGQRSKVEALREYPYPTEYDAEPGEAVAYPSAASVLNLGQTLEAEATAGEGAGDGKARAIDLNLAPELSSLLALHPWPVPDFRGAGQMGRLERPVFSTYKTMAQVITWTGRTVLVSVAEAPGAAMSDGVRGEYCYSFVRAGLSGEALAAAGAEPAVSALQRRLHFLSIRLPRNEAAVLMLQHGGDDAALYEALSQRVVAGTAALTGCAGVVCREGQRSKVESHAAFPMPGKYSEMIPDSWQEYHPGTSLEAEAEWGGEGGPNDSWNLAFEALEAPELVPFHPSAQHPALYGAVQEYTGRRMLQQVRIPASGVLCSGVLSTTGPTEDEAAASGGMTDIFFAAQSARVVPRDEKKAAASQIHLQALVLSVPAAEGPELAGAGRPPQAAADLIRRLQAGEIHCAAHAGAVIQLNRRSEIRWVSHLWQPADYYSAKTAPEVKLPASLSAAACGLEMTGDYTQGPNGIVVDGQLQWDAAPVSGFGEPGAALPEMEKRRAVEKVAFRRLSLEAGRPVIVDVRASPAREGTPEYGRWHVTMLKAD